VQKSALLAAIQKEIQRHDFSYFVDDPPSVAQRGKIAGLLVPRLLTASQLVFLQA
jgi:hypothetical protein